MEQPLGLILKACAPDLKVRKRGSQTPMQSYYVRHSSRTLGVWFNLRENLDVLISPPLSLKRDINKPLTNLDDPDCLEKIREALRKHSFLQPQI